MPHVAPWFRGISMTVSAELAHSVARSDILDAFGAYYDGEQMVKITSDIPLVRDNVGLPHASIGGFALAEDCRRLVLNSSLDNLLKGAASQALQNLNLMAGYEELEGLLRSPDLNEPIITSTSPTASK